MTTSVDEKRTLNREIPDKGLRDIIKFMATHLVTLVASFLIFKGTMATNDTSVLGTVISRLEVLENQNEKLQEKLLLTGAENLRLKLELTENITRNDLYQSFLDFLPFPAWIKVKDPEGGFRMLMINNAYVYKYGISKARYQGSTDSEIWGAEIAAGFEIADSAVYHSKNFIETNELIPTQGVGSEPKPARGWKFAIKVGANAVGVGGVVVLDSKIHPIDEAN